MSLYVSYLATLVTRRKKIWHVRISGLFTMRCINLSMRTWTVIVGINLNMNIFQFIFGSIFGPKLVDWSTIKRIPGIAVTESKTMRTGQSIAYEFGTYMWYPYGFLKANILLQMFPFKCAIIFDLIFESQHGKKAHRIHHNIFEET